MDTRATFTVTTKGFVDESFFGAMRRKFATELRGQLGPHQHVEVAVDVEVLDLDAPPPPPAPTEAEVALADHVRQVNALLAVQEFLRS